MNIPQKIKRMAPAFTAFILVGGGTLLILPNQSSDNSGDDLVPTVIMKTFIEAGTTTKDVALSVEITEIPEAARANGALSSLNQLPQGVLVSDHVEGQQVLLTSFSKSSVAALGDNYVAVSVRLDTQRWLGPIRATGEFVNVYAVTPTSASIISLDAVVLDTPEVEDIKAKDESIISLGVKKETLGAVLSAARDNSLWLTGR
jgi:hypothetical protein